MSTGQGLVPIMSPVKRTMRMFESFWPLQANKNCFSSTKADTLFLVALDWPGSALRTQSTADVRRNQYGQQLFEGHCR